MNLNRVRNLNNHEYSGGSILYWMGREQRVNDNWALIYSQELSKKFNKPFAVVFCLSKTYPDINKRQILFLLENLKYVADNLKNNNIPFYILEGEPANTIPNFIHSNGIGILVSDFSPLKADRINKQKVLKKISIPFYEVDAHNIVPVWIASDKLEYGAYTIRNKIQRLLNEYLEEFPKIKRQILKWENKVPNINWKIISDMLRINPIDQKINWIKPGENEAHKVLLKFLQHKLKYYSEKRNDPNFDAQSNLSPYLHFGQISSQRIALEVEKTNTDLSSKEVFLEELIIRKELSDNFCYYNQDYDSFKGFPKWAQETLNKHRLDKRENIYNLRQFENADTHDSLWNAAQIEMIERGKLHGYMRMYWAKKILEWTKHPEDAINIATYLNDKYELDGNDPNGYTGIAWSIGGVHDRPWGERKIFGKIRYMSLNGCKRKFDINLYIKKYNLRNK